MIPLNISEIVENFMTNCMCHVLQLNNPFLLYWRYLSFPYKACDLISYKIHSVFVEHHNDILSRDVWIFTMEH